MHNQRKEMKKKRNCSNSICNQKVALTAFKHYNGVEVKDRNYAKPSLPFFFTTYQYLQFPFILKFCRYTRTRDRSVECCILVTFTQDQKNILPRVKKRNATT